MRPGVVPTSGSHLLTGLVSLLALGACSTGGGELTPLGPVPREVTVEFVDADYTVQGSTEDELLAAMRIGGPGNGWYGFTWESRYTWRHGPIEQASINPGVATEPRCEIKEVSIRLRFRRSIPRWKPPEDVDPELVAKWEVFDRAVRLHGEGHRDIAVGYTQEAIRRMRDLETEDCSLMRSEARALMDRIHDQYVQRNREYEAEQREAGAVRWPETGTGR